MYTGSGVVLEALEGLPVHDHLGLKRRVIEGIESNYLVCALDVMNSLLSTRHIIVLFMSAVTHDQSCLSREERGIEFSLMEVARSREYLDRDY